MIETSGSAGAGDATSWCAGVIRDAFADVLYPGDHGIGRRTAGYLASEHYEGRQVERFFAGHTWQDITIAVLRTFYEGDSSACLFFMSPAGFHYYLPSYLLMALDDFVAADMIPHALMSALRPRSRVSGAADDPDDTFFANIEPFSPAQRHAVARFLLAMNANHGASFSWDNGPASLLRLFWQQYLDDTERSGIDDTIGYDMPSEAEIKAKLEPHLDAATIATLVAKST